MIMSTNLIRQAVQLFGTEARLAEATGYTQPAINRAKHSGRVSAEMAARIDAATGGQVSRFELRPDVFGIPPRPSSRLTSPTP